MDARQAVRDAIEPLTDEQLKALREALTDALMSTRQPGPGALNFARLEAKEHGDHDSGDSLGVDGRCRYIGNDMWSCGWLDGSEEIDRFVWQPGDVTWNQEVQS